MCNTVLGSTFAWTSDQGAFLVFLLSGQRDICYFSFSGFLQVHTWLVSFSSYLSGELLLGAHAKQPKVGEQLDYGVPRQVPTVSRIPIQCRSWTMEVILDIMMVREVMLATKCGLTMLMFCIHQIIVWCYNCQRFNKLSKIMFIHHMMEFQHMMQYHHMMKCHHVMVLHHMIGSCDEIPSHDPIIWWSTILWWHFIIWYSAIIW